MEEVKLRSRGSRKPKCCYRSLWHSDMSGVFPEGGLLWGNFVVCTCKGAGSVPTSPAHISKCPLEREITIN